MYPCKTIKCWFLSLRVYLFSSVSLDHRMHYRVIYISKLCMKLICYPLEYALCTTWTDCYNQLSPILENIRTTVKFSLDLRDMYLNDYWIKPRWFSGTFWRLVKYTFYNHNFWIYYLLLRSSAKQGHRDCLIRRINLQDRYSNSLIQQTMFVLSDRELQVGRLSLPTVKHIHTKNSDSSQSHYCDIRQSDTEISASWK